MYVNTMCTVLYCGLFRLDAPVEGAYIYEYIDIMRVCIARNEQVLQQRTL